MCTANNAEQVRRKHDLVYEPEAGLALCSVHSARLAREIVTDATEPGQCSAIQMHYKRKNNQRRRATSVGTAKREVAGERR